MQTDEIERFVRTGDYDSFFPNWSGQNLVEKAQRGSAALTEALLSEVRRRESKVTVSEPAEFPEDLVEFTREKIAPMVRGLFPQKEQDLVLSLLERSVVFLTPETIEPLIRKAGFLGTAWQVANVYLVGIGAEPLAEEMEHVVGLSVDTTCYVSLAFFSEDDPFADFVVHEAAHIFHNTKRRHVGLRETRRREWLLPIEYRKRETFAYACEAYSCIVGQSSRPSERRNLLERLKHNGVPPDDRVELEEYFDILDHAVDRRNGWKAILERCSTRE